MIPSSYDGGFLGTLLALLGLMGLFMGIALVVGLAVLRWCSVRDAAPLAPALGMCVLLAVAYASNRLPGTGRTAAVACGAILLASIGTLAWRLRRRRPSLVAIATVVLASLACTLPYLVHARVGVLGPGYNDDFAPHLYWAEVFSQGRSLEGIADTNYPVGPHVLVSAMAVVLPQVNIEMIFMALALTVHPLAAVTALAAIGPVPRVLRVVAGLIVAFPYLLVSYTAQGAFKEPLMAVLLLTLVLLGRHLRSAGMGAPRRALLQGALLVLPVAAMFGVYGRSGMVWPAGIVGAWLVLELAQSRPRLSRRRLAILAPAVLVAAGVAWFVILPVVRELLALGAVPGGQPPGFLPTEQIFGIWHSADMRFPPPNVLRDGILIGLVAALFGWGLVRAIRHREFVLIAGAVVALLATIPAQRSGQPYFAAKALVIATPFVMLVVVWAATALRVRWRGLRQVEGLAVAALFAVVAANVFQSSIAAAGNARVSSLDRDHELAPIRERIEGEQTLFLGQDYFIYTKLRGARISAMLPYSVYNQAPVTGTPTKAPDRGTVIDWDAVDPVSLDGLRYVVTPRGSYQSEPYENWKRVERTASYDLYRRKGPTVPRERIEDQSAPGAVLDCGERRFRDLVAAGGTARVRPAPVVLPRTWRLLDGNPVDPGLVPPGVTITQRATLPAGTWDLSLQYSSPYRLRLRAPGVDHRLPADPDLIGQFWHAGTLESDGSAITIEVTVDAPAINLTGSPVGLGSLAAVRTDEPARTVPLAEACGQYVDWYRPASQPQAAAAGA